jgi:hypothetical protein
MSASEYQPSTISEESRPKVGASSASSVSSEEETEETEKSQNELSLQPRKARRDLRQAARYHVGS